MKHHKSECSCAFCHNVPVSEETKQKHRGPRPGSRGVVLMSTRKKLSAALTGKKKSEEHVRNMSIALKGRVISSETKAKLSIAGKGKKRTQQTKDKIKAARARQVLPTKDTRIEVILQSALTAAGIKFSTHAPIVGQPDIFVEPNVCVFADGDYWHRRPERVRRDEYVNRKLKEQGYVILRFWETDIHHDLERCITDIIKASV